MKVRKGFVSNSSSSSFVCDITGETESGWDMSLDEAGMCECEAGHTFYYDGYTKVEEWLEEERDYYNVPSSICPICSKDPETMKTISERIAGDIKRFDLTLDDIAKVL